MPFPAAELTRHHMENYLRLAMKGRGERGAIKSSLEGWTAPNITKASSLSHRSKGSLTGKKARRVL